MAQKTVKPLGLSKKKGIFKRELPFYLMLIPGVLFALVFSYGPMFGLVMAFQDFTPLKSFENSPWVGFENFRMMLQLPTFWPVVRNTLVISLSTVSYTHLDVYKRQVGRGTAADTEPDLLHDAARGCPVYGACHAPNVVPGYL